MENSENSKEVMTAIEEGKCLFGTVDTWIIWVCAYVECIHDIVCVYWGRIK